MANYIKISNLENNATWKKDLTGTDLHYLKGYLKGKKAIPIFPATLKPVRTNNLKNFSKDFFLPTTINQAIKVQKTVGKIFAVLASLVLDIATFPIRLLTCIPRVIINSKQKEDLLRQYLVGEGVDKKILASDHVRVKLGWEETSKTPTSTWTDSDGVVQEVYALEQRWEEGQVNFIEVPTYEGYDHYASGVSGLI